MLKITRELKARLLGAMGADTKTAADELSQRAFFNGDQDAFEVLCEAARSAENQETVIAAVEGLGLLGKKGREAVPIICVHLSSEDRKLREEAVKALAKMKGAATDAVSTLEAMIDTQDDGEQFLIIAALKKITGDERYKRRQRRKGGSVWWGIRAHDDPVYNEGYTVTLGSGFRKK
jgi:hypothetical protein